MVLLMFYLPVLDLDHIYFQFTKTIAAIKSIQPITLERLGSLFLLRRSIGSQFAGDSTANRIPNWQCSV